MARKIIDIGNIGNDGTGDSIRDSFRKVNDNFQELYSSLGLGERLSFVGLSDTPDEYISQQDENSLVTVNNSATGLVFKQLIDGSGISIVDSGDSITISSAFQTISADPNPQLGGDLDASKPGGGSWKIENLGTPVSDGEAVNKGYADSKISLAGVDAVNPETEEKEPSFGQMTGPLILSRDPEADDDDVWGGRIAATKRYVDTSAFGSTVNLYVATSGRDTRPEIDLSSQGRALAYAYRTVESALKRAEEIMLESPVEMGPYKKVLTYTDSSNVINNCTLDSIEISPNSGSGFSGLVLMSVDTITIKTPGVNYQAGDIITLDGGTFLEPARFEILATTATPRGGAATLRTITSGVYTALPGSEDIAVTSTSDFGVGVGLTFDVTYKVNSVQVQDGGNDYGLVSIRILPNPTDTTGSGAFGTADVVGGSIQSITITDQGKDFSELPTVLASLPRFLIKTEGFKTDFTNDPGPTRDIREGLYLRGETSGALAQILAHDGSLDNDGNEIFDVDIQFGNFVEGEIIAYGDVTRLTQISVLVESGIYEENLPLKVPQNVSIIGDEFRRVIIRPKTGSSSSPWASALFRRDTVIDGMSIVDNLFGYHYLTDPTEPIYPLINNRGFYRAAANLIQINRLFIQKEVIAWINEQVENATAPFSNSFTYNQIQYETDIGLILDAISFDLKWGGSNRILSEGLKYFDVDSNKINLSTQLNQLLAVVGKIDNLIQLVVTNTEITNPIQEAISQTIDQAFVTEAGSTLSSFSIANATKTNPVVLTSETAHKLTRGDIITVTGINGMTELNDNSFYVDITGSNTVELYTDEGLTTPLNGTGFDDYIDGGSAINQGGVIGALIDTFEGVITESSDLNIPKQNTDMDMFLCNDAVRFQAVTMQSQGGFAMVLDPTGQILTKSPYAQECSSFSRSTGKQTFAGGMFIDGFSGNIEFKITGKAELLATQLLTGRSYTIKTVGDTDFTLIGADSNTVGEVFVATDQGTGTGVVEDNTRIYISDLQRIPQLPASFIVDDTVYRINYVRDFTFNVTGSTATLVLDEITPWPFDVDSSTYEILTPGNRSMLGNDFTQINDMGYGIITTNGGLCEAVSVFTYYNYASLYSINGGQIRSVSGSSAHGRYGLVAEGFDPLEIPTPIELHYDLAQGVECHFPSSFYANEKGGLSIWIRNFNYLPLTNSELEIYHPSEDAVFRYPVVGVSLDPNNSTLTRLSIRTSEGIGSEGLADIVADGTKMTVRMNSAVVVTGDNITDVPTRPSTGVVFDDSDSVYRVLQFNAYEDPVSATTNLTEAVLRENYDYIELTTWNAQPYVSGSEKSVDGFSVGSPGTVDIVGHGFSQGDIIRFEAGAGSSLPGGLTENRHYWVKTVLSADQFTVSDTPSGTVLDFTDAAIGSNFTVGLVIGEAGDQEFGIVELSVADAARVIGSRLVWIGEEYIVTGYSDTSITGEDYALLTLDQPLVDSVIDYISPASLKSGTSAGTNGTLTVRISLVRASSHDLLEIGTGSYADTNYPNEIYGVSANSLNAKNEVVERSVGRVFYATTDQFGNFNVGPYFRVDQGTGTVTFAASIALSNLDGLGFKRGVPISEFSFDSSFVDNAQDAVPTEQATRTYIERRLGLTHFGTEVPSEELIPADTGGFLAVNGILSMKDNLNLGNNKIVSMSDPTSSTDGVNLRSLTFDNFQDVVLTSPSEGDILAFTGTDNLAREYTITGDISLSPGISPNTLDAQITAGIIENSDINATASIEQSKLSLNSASTRTDAAGITQADLGSASFSNTYFDSTNGWISLKDNGVSLDRLEKIASRTVLGNSALTEENVDSVSFSNVVNLGGAIKKSQFSSGPGFLKRITTTFNSDSDYSVVDSASTSTPSTLVSRDANGDFSTRRITVERLNVDGKITLDTTTSATGGYVSVYGFLGQTGILIGDGSVSTDKVTFYDNDRHEFRTQNGAGLANVTLGNLSASGLTTTLVTTGGATTEGTLTGDWTLSSNSGLTFGSGDLIMGAGTLDVSSGTLTARDLTTGNSSTAGTVTGLWSLTNGSRFEATYADLAEYYEGDREYEVGTVLIFGGDKEVTLSTKANDYRVAGVVSDNAAYTMNSECPGHKICVALQGRVLCRVVGKISKGDLMVTSNIAGVAISSKGQAMPGTIIGKALETYDSDHIGKIEIAVGRT